MDRIVRLVLGVVAVAAAALIGFWSSWGLLLLAVGGILLLTAAVSFCPIYRLLGFSTCRDAG